MEENTIRYILKTKSKYALFNARRPPVRTKIFLGEIVYIEHKTALLSC